MAEFRQHFCRLVSDTHHPTREAQPHAHTGGARVVARHDHRNGGSTHGCVVTASLTFDGHNVAVKRPIIIINGAG